MEDEQRPLVLRFIFQFRLSFVLKSSMWMRTNQGVGAAGTPEGRAAVQRNKDRPGKWANRNLMKSNKD